MRLGLIPVICTLGLVDLRVWLLAHLRDPRLYGLHGLLLLLNRLRVSSLRLRLRLLRLYPLWLLLGNRVWRNCVLGSRCWRNCSAYLLLRRRSLYVVSCSLYLLWQPIRRHTKG